MNRLEARRVLIAEDDYLVQESIADMVTQTGHRVVGMAANGRSAIEMARKTKPDVILMDIKMPVLDGLEAAREINKERPTPVVILSAYETDELINTALDAGVVAYLAKPASSGDLARTISFSTARFQEHSKLKKRYSEIVKDKTSWNNDSELVTICSVCKKVRKEENLWESVEAYIRDCSHRHVSHGLCPICAESLYGHK